MEIAEELRRAKGLLSVKQVAEVLGSHPQTIYGWVNDGKLPHVRVCSRIKFDGNALADWLKRRTL